MSKTTIPPANQPTAIALAPPTRARARLRWAGLLLLLAAVLLATASCGGGGGWYYEPYGTLEVRNDPFSFEGIDAVELSMFLGPIDHYDLFLAPGDLDWIDLIPGTYDVDILWSDGAVDTFFDVDIYDGATTIVTGLN